MTRAGLAPPEGTLAARITAALREVGADSTWRWDSGTNPADPKFENVSGNYDVSDDRWALLWQAFGIAGGAGGGWKVPCLRCYLDGDAFSDYSAGIDRCEDGWPARECGREERMAS